MDSTRLYRTRSRSPSSPKYYDTGRDSQFYYSPTSADRKKTWFTFTRSPKPSGEDGMSTLQRETDFLRSHVRDQDMEIAHLKKKLHLKDQQQADLQAKWNFHAFKFQLLVDMWAMRVLDNESELETEYQ